MRLPRSGIPRAGNCRRTSRLPCRRRGSFYAASCSAREQRAPTLRSTQRPNMPREPGEGAAERCEAVVDPWRHLGMSCVG